MKINKHLRNLKDVDKMFLATKREIEVELNRIKKAIKLRTRKEITDNEDFYTFSNVIENSENDLISSQEAGFMLGYLEA